MAGLPIIPMCAIIKLLNHELDRERTPGPSFIADMLELAFRLCYNGITQRTSIRQQGFCVTAETLSRHDGLRTKAVCRQY